MAAQLCKSTRRLDYSETLVIRRQRYVECYISSLLRGRCQCLPTRWQGRQKVLYSCVVPLIEDLTSELSGTWPRCSFRSWFIQIPRFSLTLNGVTPRVRSNAS